jgi:hypothetical protein
MRSGSLKTSKETHTNTLHQLQERRTSSEGLYCFLHEICKKYYKSRRKGKDQPKKKEGRDQQTHLCPFGSCGWVVVSSPVGGTHRGTEVMHRTASDTQGKHACERIKPYEVPSSRKPKKVDWTDDQINQQPRPSHGSGRPCEGDEEREKITTARAGEERGISSSAGAILKNWAHQQQRGSERKTQKRLIIPKRKAALQALLHFSSTSLAHT